MPECFVKQIEIYIDKLDSKLFLKCCKIILRFKQVLEIYSININTVYFALWIVFNIFLTISFIYAFLYIITLIMSIYY